MNTHRFRSTIATLLLGTSVWVSSAPQADAFGPTCVPRLQNCMCTFLNPCPVADTALRGEMQGALQQFQQQNQILERYSKALDETAKNVACNSTSSLPGLNSIGIDLNGLLRAQLPNLRIDQLEIPGLDKIREAMAQMQLDPQMLQQVLAGQISPDAFLRMAEAAGVDIGALEDIGVSLTSLQGLATGDTKALMQMGLDRMGVDLAQVGLAQDALSQIAAGNLSVDGFLQQAQAAGLSIPQLESFGIPLDTLHTLSSGQLANLGLPNIDAVMAQVSRVSVDPATLQGMLSGQMDPSRLLSMAEASGLSPSTLQHMGVSPQTLQSIAGGSMNPQQLLEMSDALNFKGTALQSLGINQQLLSNIASGSLQPNAITNIAQGAGLTMPDLQGLGLDPSSLTSMVQAGPTGLMSTLQNAGMGNPILDGLNIDAGMLGKIASGELPASAINDLMANTGLDPRAIVIPGLDGPLTALGNMEGAINGPIDAINGQLAGLNSQIGDMIKLPIPSIPGLNNVLGSCGSGVSPDLSVGAMGQAGDGGAGAPTPAGTGGADDTTGAGAGTAGSLAGTGTGSGAICMPNRPLISTTEPPSTFTADVTTLDFALAGNGDVFQHEEAIADATAEAHRSLGNGVARSIVMRPIIAEALDSIKPMEEQLALITANGTDEEAWKMNSAIKIHLLSAHAELASLRSYLTTVDAAERVNKFTFSPLPLFPHDSRWDEQFEETIRPGAQALTEQAGRGLAAGRSYNDLAHQARATQYAHQAAVYHQQTAATLPDLTADILFAESQKESLYHMETQIRQALAQLYVDPDAAWALFQRDMQANAGAYTTPGKWGMGVAVGDQLSDIATAQAPSTRYGQRRENPNWRPRTNDEENEIPRYTTVGEMPYRYAYVDSRAEPGDPFSIQRPFRNAFGLGGNRDDEEPPPPAMSGGIQTYLEAYRRERVWTPMRRGGNGERGTSGAAWNELVTYAPQCLMAPIPTTQENLIRRPDLFDVNPTCSHLVWTDGDEEDYIPSTHFGGFDAVLWAAKIEMDKARLQVGAPTHDPAAISAALAQRAANVKMLEQSQNIEAELRATGEVQAADHVLAIRAMLDAIEADTSLITPVPMPRFGG